MTDKVLCPWCGAEMRASVAMLDVYGAIARYECSFCHACGPQRRGLQKEETSAAARAAALRRYTPPIKPMTWDEVAAMPEMCWYERVEGIEYPILPMAVHGGALKFAIRNGTMYAHTEGYNRTWRCWEREPTDEERGAAEWET